jgi:hypothetical protein
MVLDQAGHGQARRFAAGETSPDPGNGHITGWTWKPGAHTEADRARPAGAGVGDDRYQAYQAQLAGHAIGETFTRAATFRKLAVADTPALTDG